MLYPDSISIAALFMVSGVTSHHDDVCTEPLAKVPVNPAAIHTSIMHLDTTTTTAYHSDMHF